MCPAARLQQTGGACLPAITVLVDESLEHAARQVRPANCLQSHARSIACEQGLPRLTRSCARLAPSRSSKKSVQA